MTTQAVKVKNEESQGSAITGAAAGVGERVTGTIANTREFLHDVRVEMKQVTWPSREDVVATTWVVIATVAFFGAFLAVVDKLVQLGVAYVFKRFGV
ncbi:MAG TPA: preprotein translocase subunit SecE [Candidatus Acidoferrales bacterium]|jgi:preprotein translocase subunit SecE|nr:preprotein translocase subunit SecE [Candidatus Acidoferrales bacterium]